MNIFGLILFLVIIGVVLWLIETYLPLDPVIKIIIRVILVLVIIFWLLQMFGITGPSLPRLKWLKKS